jgi:hypothetical protein
MKNIFSLIFILIACSLAAQNSGNDVVYLKNGSIIKGIIIKNLSDSTTSVKTQDGSVFVYKNNDILRIVVAANGNSYKRNNLWLGINFEPQFQNIFKNQKEVQHLMLKYNESMLLPGNGGVQLGFNLCYLPMGRAGFETGLQYHLYQNKEIFSFPLNGVTGTTTEANSFQCLEVPVLINVHTNGKKIRFYSSNGISAGLILSASHSLQSSAAGYATHDTSFTTHADSTASIYCTILTSAGIQLSLTPNILLNLTAAFRLSAGGILGATNPFYVPNSYAFFPFSFGINAEVLFHPPSKTNKGNNNLSLPPQKF